MARTSSDPLKAFLSMRVSLEAERAKLSARLTEIEVALGTFAAAVPAKAAGKAAKPVAASGSRKRAQNELSLKEAVLKALEKKPLTKAEILEGVQKVGYKFTAKNPTNSLNTLLYGKKPTFKNEDGKFSAA